MGVGFELSKYMHATPINEKKTHEFEKEQEWPMGVHRERKEKRKMMSVYFNLKTNNS